MEFAFVTVLWHPHPQTQPAEGQEGKTGAQKGWDSKQRVALDVRQVNRIRRYFRSRTSRTHSWKPLSKIFGVLNCVEPELCFCLVNAMSAYWIGKKPVTEVVLCSA